MTTRAFPVHGRKRTLSAKIAHNLSFASILLLIFAFAPSANAQNTKNPICGKLGVSLQASSGAQMYCFGAQPSGATSTKLGPLTSATNVDAASTSEDISPAGVRAFGQSETSIAAAGSYVVEAWNDSTGFFSTCPAPRNKEELTGFAFSNNGGASFVDEGGVPNNICSQYIAFGDPSVEVYQTGGNTYFYITSLFLPVSGTPETALVLTACVVQGSGSSATLSCNQPIFAAVSSDCANFSGFEVCSFLDKEFMTIDRNRHRLYISYAEFGVSAVSPFGQIDLASCNLTNPAAPVCSNGSKFNLASPSPVAPYLVVNPGNANCESEGAYPAVDPASGDVYVGYEFNWATNFFNPVCFSTPTQNVVERVPQSCLGFPKSSCRAAHFAQAAIDIVSMDTAFVPGYNRFPAADFPRIAVSDAAGTVSIVWNDARQVVLGSILLQSYNLGSLAPVQSSPVTLNNDKTGALHFMPALRYVGTNGLLNVSWYDRRNSGPNGTLTDVYAALGVNPRQSSTPASNVRVTDVASDWNAVSSDIVPNFGDYTDNYVPPGTNHLFDAWSDGRIGEPQPFEAEPQ